MRTNLKIFRTAAFALLLLGTFSCSSSSPKPQNVDPPFKKDFGPVVRLILIGDTGLDNPQMQRLKTQIQSEKKDLVLVAGDLVYPVAPKCPNGSTGPEELALLDRSMGKNLSDLGAPVILALGNHDVAHKRRDADREACILDYAAQKEQLVMPGLSFQIDLGIGTLVVLNSNALDAPQAQLAQQAFAGEDGWKIMLGHHVLRTYHDKATEDLVLPWLRLHSLAPDLYLNGHAHLLQFGIYGKIAAVTSGATAKLRHRKVCPPDCGPGQLFGQSTLGYALLELSAERVNLVFKDLSGAELWRWSRDR